MEVEPVFKIKPNKGIRLNERYNKMKAEKSKPTPIRNDVNYRTMED